MKDKIKQILKDRIWKNAKNDMAGFYETELLDLVNDVVNDLGLSNEWVSVDTEKPKQGVRVLLTIREYEYRSYIVGYWGCGTWEACTVNVEADKDYNGNQACVERAFSNDDVTHWQPLPLPPSEVKS